MKRYNKKNRIKVRECVLLGCLISILLLFSGAIDNLFILEKKYPLYLQAVDDLAFSKVAVFSEFYEYDPQKLMENNTNILEQYSWFEGKINGIAINMDEGEIVLDGQAVIETWVWLINGFIQLDQGTYYISVGDECPYSSIYLEAWNDSGNHSIIGGLGDGIFCIGEEEATSVFCIIMPVKSGMKFDNVHITPYLTKLSDSVLDKDDEIVVCRMHKEIWQMLTESEKKRISNRMNHQYKDYLWTAIIFDDGTGIRFQNGLASQGKINSFGQILD